MGQEPGIEGGRKTGGGGESGGGGGISQEKIGLLRWTWVA